ncbi:hypothetical protein LVJ94_46585 [Pendulispora rubella]|uniref:Lipoxygenase domain-containing protein n=1 Tax=Pendulispora rubella TaxID=2741070 RepID=A0ABZ2L094_9BACT
MAMLEPLKNLLDKGPDLPAPADLAEALRKRFMSVMPAGSEKYLDQMRREYPEEMAWVDPTPLDGGPLMLRELYWRKVTAAVVRKNNVIQARREPSDADRVTPMLIGKRYPGLTGAKVFVSENTPAGEAQSPIAQLVLKWVLFQKEIIGMSQFYKDPWKGTGVPYPPEFQALKPAPEVPEDFRRGADKLAGVARRGPFSIYTKKDGQDYIVDLRKIEALETRSPFVRTGGLARFSRGSNGGLSTVSVEFQGKTYRPGGNAEWAMAEKRFLVGLNSFGTLADHLTHMHIVGAGTWTICTRLALPARHALRVVLEPFVVETMRVNNDNIDGLILSENSNVPSYTGYTLATVHGAMRDVISNFDIRWLDAEYRAKEQGLLDDPAFPTMQSAVDLFRIFRRFTSAWCKEFVPTVDTDSRNFCQELHSRVPNGVFKLLGIDGIEQLMPEHVAHLVAIGMFSESIWHCIVANMVRDYEMQFDIMPPAINAEGHPTLGLVLEKRNSITIADLLRYKLVDDRVPLPTEAMKQCWAKFQSDLKSYEADVRKDASTQRYRVIPSEVPGSIHA